MRKPQRIHVVGSSPRSGTTLTFELLVSCFDIERFGDHEISLFSLPPKVPKSVYASKKPTDFIHVCRLLRWDPALHVIYMQRDPRDVVVSQHASHPGRYWCDFDIWKRNQNLLPRLLGHPRFFMCRYEDLVTKPDQVQDALEKHFAFLHRRHDFSHFDKVSRSSVAAQMAMNGIRKISASSVGSWRDDLPRIAAQVKTYQDMPAYVVEAGYEPDRAWLAALDGVAPDNSASVRTQLNTLSRKSLPERIALRAKRRALTFIDQIRYIAGYSKD